MTELPALTDLRAAKQFLRSLSASARRRGEEYFYNDAVGDIVCAEPGVRYVAEVTGTRLYETTLFYEHSRWDSDCTCPIRLFCKHAAAVMYALLQETTGDVPAAVAAPTVIGFRRPAAPTGLLEKKLVETLARKLTPEENRYLRRVISLFARARFGAQPALYDLQQLAPGLRGHSWDAPQIWREPPRTDLEFWQYLAYYLHEQQHAVPEFMRTVADHERIGARIREWRRAEHIAEWRNWLATSATPDPTALPAGPPLDVRLKVAGPNLTIETRQGSEPEFRPLKTTRFRRLAEGHQHGHVAVTPAAEPLWHTLVERWRREYGATFRLATPENQTLLRALLQWPQLSDRIVTKHGQPFARPAEPLRWELLPPTASDGDADYRLRLVTHDNQPAPPLLAILPGQPTLYVTETAILTGPPPAPINFHLGKATHETMLTIPAAALETGHGARFLLKLGVELPPALRDRVRHIPLTVTIRAELKLTQPGRATEAVFLRIQAGPKPGPPSETYLVNGWNPLRPAKPARAETGKIVELHDRRALDALPALLVPLNPQWDNFQQCWRRRLTRDFPEVFTDWLATLPPTVEVMLDPQLASLRAPPVQGRVRLDCQASGLDWFDLSVVLDVADTELTPDELKVLLDGRGRFVRLPRGGWRRLQFNLAGDDEAQLARLGLSPHDFTSEPQRFHALQLADAAAARFLPETQAAEIRRRADELKTRVTPPLPAAVNATLRPYQIEGFHFLAYLSANRFGGVLADDMGLGKTLQALTWLAWQREQPDATPIPSLVVCPKSVMDNWRAEAERFVPGLRVTLWRGTDAAKLPAAVADADLLVVNYTQLRALGEALAARVWRVAILDEGQYIKNPDSQTAKAARALQADHRLVLTGTPIENRLLDLWSLMGFSMPGVLGPRAQFTRRFDQAADPLARQRLAARVRPFLLRRTKAQVAPELPDRVEEDLHCEMEPAQRTLYRAELKHAQQMLLKIKTRAEFDRQRFNFLTSLLRLRQICCHPALIQADQATAASAKLEALLDLLEPLMEEGHKVLVFSQFVTMLELLQPVIAARGWKQFVLTGDTENRGPLVAEFQSAPGAAVFLISLKAGGFGLNLTAASYVVLFDPWWNPAVENQAIDRTHRIGQTRPVNAYRLLIKDSIEEKIRQLQRTKRALAEDILGEEKFAQSLTLDDLRFLFTTDTG